MDASRDLTISGLRALARPLFLAHVAALAFVIDERMKPLLQRYEPVWTLAILFALPLGAALIADARRPRGRVLGAIGAVVALAAPLWRWGFATRDAFVDRPELLVVPAVAATAIVAVGALLDLDLDRYGLGLGDLRWWGPRVGALLVVILPFVGVSAVLFPDLLAYYPSRSARGELSVFATVMAGRAVYFVAWEWFFRGFLLFGFADALGVNGANVAQGYPFLLLHRGKPVSEMCTSFTGALGLGALCWRAGTMWPAVILHWWLNVSMETLGWISRSSA